MAVRCHGYMATWLWTVMATWCAPWATWLCTVMATYFLLKISIKFLSAVMYVLEAENFTLALGSQIYIEGFHCPPLRFNFVCNIHICISREIG